MAGRSDPALFLIRRHACRREGAGRAFGRLHRTWSKAHPRLHFDRVGYADALHDRLQEHCGSEDYGAIRALSAEGDGGACQRKDAGRKLQRPQPASAGADPKARSDFDQQHRPSWLALPSEQICGAWRALQRDVWLDSYFIVRGLLRAGRVDLARGMVDNFLFEIEHYGAMLNANRTYYLTRSQPPFVSSMFVDVYEAVL